VVALAPTFLRSEIEDHLSDISADTGVQLADVRHHWQDFQAKLNFYEPQYLGGRGIKAIDPDDVPYQDACEELGANAVYSRDVDFRAMKGPVVTQSQASELMCNASCMRGPATAMQTRSR
jgi:hypothetical protein